jgi:hypothetical protein
MRTYTREQIWKAIERTWATAPEAYVMPNGTVMPIKPTKEDEQEVKEFFFEQLELVSNE